MYSNEQIRGNRSLDSRHFSSSNSIGREIRGHRSQETSHCISSNCGGHGRGSSLISHSSSFNCRGCVDSGGSKSQDISHSSSHNKGTQVGVEGRV